MEKTIKDLDIYISDGNYSSKYPRSEEFVDDGIPFIRGNNMVDGDITDDEMYHITPEKHAVLLKGHVKAGDVLITTRGNIGQVAIVPDRHEDSNINAQIVLLRTNPESLYNRYLLWALQSQRANEQYLALQTGTALKQLPVGKLEKLSIKVADINKQHEIADVLDKSYGVIKARRNELKLLDELIKARFVELFGNPFDTTMWNVKGLKDVSESMIDGSNVNPDYYESEGDVLFLRIQNVWRNEFRLDDSVYISQEINSEQYHDTSLKTGDLLITKIGRYYTKDSSLGRVSVYRGKDDGANYSNNIMRVRLLSFMNSEFVNALLNLDDYQSFIKRTSKGGTDKRALSKSLIGSYPIIVPPKELQDGFADFIKQVDKSKVVVQDALDEAQILFESLMQKYFGEKNG